MRKFLARAFGVRTTMMIMMMMAAVVVMVVVMEAKEEEGRKILFTRWCVKLTVLCFLCCSGSENFGSSSCASTFLSLALALSLVQRFQIHAREFKLCSQREEEKKQQRQQKRLLR
jgi:Ca2+/H+ antiporter